MNTKQHESVGCGFDKIRAAVASCILLTAAGTAEETSAGSRFRDEVQPILQGYCYDCHAEGVRKGNVSFDELEAEALVANHELWSKVLENIRAGLMPPQKESQPSSEQREELVRWIKYTAFNIDPRNPDPGRVTVRRLNRVEYRNTIRDLLGVEFNTQEEFPADDTGYGFDNIADVLTISPMLLEKYLDAARAVVARAVPVVASVVMEKRITGRSFVADADASVRERAGNRSSGGALTLSYYNPALVTNSVQVEHRGRYQLVVDLNASEHFVDNQFDYNQCELVFRADGQELLRKQFVREGDKSFTFEFDREWEAGAHELSVEVKPLTQTDQIRSLSLRLDSVTVRGPFDENHFTKPENYNRFFPRAVPQDEELRRGYAGELLGTFASRAFRRPVDEPTVQRLTGLAESIYTQPKQTFEAGVAQAMVAVLASPRFLFREEAVISNPEGDSHPLIDEHALASRLSYFLWSTMPDDELMRLANEKSLRGNLATQVSRMLADGRSAALVRNFSGQWLQTRDIDSVEIDSRAVLRRESGETGNPGGGPRFGNEGRGQRVQLDGELRKAMREETEHYFGYIVHENRSVLELIESDYTFLNERLARHYGLTNLNITGGDMRRVILPADSERGGVLTHGTVLAVTSNPSRTSPVKRGVFILDNILGTPPPPPPPDISPLENAGRSIDGRTPTLRETLAAHREQPLCSSCHNRMDPLGLALENFNAMGMWRTEELKQPIDVGGTLITGESFTNVQTLKHILATKHRTDFYRTLATKLLTYALGRGLTYLDVETVDQIASGLDKEDGRFDALVRGVIDSAPFQKTRSPTRPATVNGDKPQPKRTDPEDKP